MELEAIKSAIKNLAVKERRQIALYILELEKEHVQNAVGPQIAQDVDAVSKIAHDAIQKLKKIVERL